MVVQARARATREAIIVGAARVFDEQGYGNTSLSDVSERSEVTKGALYFHFKSKDELARAVIQEQHTLTVAAGNSIVRSDQSPLASMVLLCRVFGRQLLAEPVVRAGIRLSLEASAFGYSVKEPYQYWISTMESLAARAKANGDIRAEVDESELARYVVASFTGVQILANVLTRRQDLMQRIDEMWHLLLLGIVPPGRSVPSLGEDPDFALESS